MADENMLPKGEILPPNRQLGPRMPDWVKPALVTGGCTVGGGALAVWAFNWFLQSRGYQSMNGSRVFLALAYLGVAVVAFGWTRQLPHHRNRWFVAFLVLLALVAAGFDRLIPMAEVVPLSSSSTHTRPSDWRTIKDWQKAELAPILEQYPNYTLHIVASSVSDEAWDYANQLKDFFAQHKWTVVGPETATGNQIILGMQLSVSEDYWGKPRPEAFSALDSELQFVRMKESKNFVLDPLVNPNILLMWIGPQPPPGFPQHIPLQLGAMCSNRLNYTDDTMHFIGSPKDFVRWLRISPPKDSRFASGQRLLVLLSKPATKVATSQQFQVQALGKIMPRPDALDVTIAKDLRVGEKVDMKIISDEELRVRCVEEVKP